MTKKLLKLLVLPIVAAVTLIQWVFIFVTSFSALIFNLLAGLLFLVAVIAFISGDLSDALLFLTIGFIIFMIPRIAEWLIIKIATFNCSLREFIKS